METALTGRPAGVVEVALAGGRTATVSLRPDSTSIAFDGADVDAYDLAGRPYVLVRGGWTWRRALHGWFLRKRTEPGEGRRRERVEAGAGQATLEAAHRDARALRDALPRAGVGPDPRARLDRIVAMDPPALQADAGRAASVYRPVGVLPPDCYLSLVLQATEGCSWNGCVFCTLFRDAPFRSKDAAAFEAHVRDVLAYLGDGAALRRSVFLGAANALCASDDRVHAWFDVLVRTLPGRGVAAFVDAWTGARREPASWRRLAERGLRTVYVGLETGDPGLLAWLGKRGTPEDAVALVRALREGGVAAGVIVLLGAGGPAFAAAHVERTAAVLSRMQLTARDTVYFSDLRLAEAEPGTGTAPLDRAGCAAQRAGIVARAGPALAGVRQAAYDLEEFVY